MAGSVYLAIIGDVIRSRQVADRASLQARLAHALSRLNADAPADLAARFVLTVGDEFQGLLASAERLVPILSALRTAAHPDELRFGLGIGELATPLQPDAIGMDGPCFHRARAAIERAVERGTTVEVDAGAPVAAFDTYAILYSALRTGWTERQRQVLDLALAGMSGKGIATALDISPSAVSQHLTAANHDAVEVATDLWLNRINRLMETAP
jgi:DNA-binding CsgD family transcriptional regulator